MQPPAKVYFDHAPRKVQTGVTWRLLIDKIAEVMVTWRAANGLEPDQPCIIVCDNVASHDKDLLQRPGGAAGVHCEHLWQCIPHPSLFFFYILPGLSHTLQSGDFHVNLSLRRLSRGAAKLRVVP